MLRRTAAHCWMYSNSMGIRAEQFPDSSLFFSHRFSGLLSAATSLHSSTWHLTPNSCCCFPLLPSWHLCQGSSQVATSTLPSAHLPLQTTPSISVLGTASIYVFSPHVPVPQPDWRPKALRSFLVTRSSSPKLTHLQSSPPRHVHGTLWNSLSSAKNFQFSTPSLSYLYQNLAFPWGLFPCIVLRQCLFSILHPCRLRCPPYSFLTSLHWHLQTILPSFLLPALPAQPTASLCCHALLNTTLSCWSQLQIYSSLPFISWIFFPFL